MKITIVVDVPELEQETAEWAGEPPVKTVTGREPVDNPLLDGSQSAVTEETYVRVVDALAFLGTVESVG